MLNKGTLVSLMGLKNGFPIYRHGRLFGLKVIGKPNYRPGGISEKPGTCKKVSGLLSPVVPEEIQNVFWGLRRLLRRNPASADF